MTTLWIAIIVVGVLTFTMRFSFIALADRLRLPTLMGRALRFIPIAALSAIILPELVLRDGAVASPLGNARMLAGALAIAVAFATRNILLTIASGMVT
nr:AzlD domain-containing protein [Ktedonobacterales bacterium]